MSIPDLPTITRSKRHNPKVGTKYHILGTVQQTLVVELQPNQVVYSDAGAMSWMTSTVDMNTKSGGGLGGMLKRAVSGATVFIIDFSATGATGQVSFSTDFPGKVCRSSWTPGSRSSCTSTPSCAPRRASDLDVFFTRKLGAGLFGGEGFILQKLTGPGMTFAELDGDAVEYNLKAGEVMRVEPGHVAMFESSVSFDIQMVKGIANILAGGEGLFLATLTGPGRIWLHSMTVSKMAHRLMEFMPAKSGG